MVGHGPATGTKLQTKGGDDVRCSFYLDNSDERSPTKDENREDLENQASATTKPTTMTTATTGTNSDPNIVAERSTVESQVADNSPISPPIGRARAMSECGDGSPIKGILKRRSSYGAPDKPQPAAPIRRQMRSISFSGGGGGQELSHSNSATAIPDFIPEEEGEGDDDVYGDTTTTADDDDYSDAAGTLLLLSTQSDGFFGPLNKKSVRFSDRIQQSTFRPNSSILGQRKKNERKAKWRLRRRARSEGSMAASTDEEGDHLHQQCTDDNDGTINQDSMADKQADTMSQGKSELELASEALGIKISPCVNARAKPAGECVSATHSRLMKIRNRCLSEPADFLSGNCEAGDAVVENAIDSSVTDAIDEKGDAPTRVEPSTNTRRKKKGKKARSRNTANDAVANDLAHKVSDLDLSDAPDLNPPGRNKPIRKLQPLYVQTETESDKHRDSSSGVHMTSSDWDTDQPAGRGPGLRGKGDTKSGGGQKTAAAVDETSDFCDGYASDDSPEILGVAAKMRGKDATNKKQGSESQKNTARKNNENERAKNESDEESDSWVQVKTTRKRRQKKRTAGRGNSAGNGNDKHSDADERGCADAANKNSGETKYDITDRGHVTSVEMMKNSNNSMNTRNYNGNNAVNDNKIDDMRTEMNEGITKDTKEMFKWAGGDSVAASAASIIQANGNGVPGTPCGSTDSKDSGFDCWEQWSPPIDKEGLPPQVS